jgi:hypothetical protein
MSDLREFGIEVTESDEGVRYQLPLRPLGQYRPFCLILIVFGLFFAIIPALGIHGFAGGFARVLGIPGILGLVLTILSNIPFLLAGLAVSAFGLLIMSGRSRIEITSTYLISFEGVGSWGWTRRRPLDSLRRFKVGRMEAKHNEKPITEGPLSDLAILRAEFKDAKSLAMAPGYPRSWLHLVAEDIARRRPETGDVTDPEAESTKVQVIDEVRQDPDLADYPEQPVTSRVQVEQQPNSVVLTVPPLGVWRGSKGLFLFGFLWCAFMAVVTCAPLMGGMQGNWLIFMLVGIVFWAFGIAMLLAAINMGHRRAVLAVVDDTVMIYQTGLFRAKRHEWTAKAIDQIRVGPSGMKVNDVPVRELQIHPKEGNKFGLLAGRDVNELRWMATILRRGIGQSSPDPEARTNRYDVDQPEQPAGSRVRIELQPNSVVLTVPPAGIWRGSKGMFGAGLFGCAFMIVFLSIVIFAGLEDPAFIAVPSFLLCACIALVVGGINMGCRRAVLAVVDGTLMVYQTSLIGGKRHEWPKDAVSAIRAAPSDFRTGEVTDLQLQIHPTKGEMVGLLTGRDKQELRWIATVLRRNLGSANCTSQSEQA